jgi:hypothetical protein
MAFFELSFDTADFQNCGFESREDLEDPLEQALQSAGIGEVTGGGSGRGRTNIDIETFDGIPDDEAVETIRAILKSLGAPRSAVLASALPMRHQWAVFQP